MTGKARRQAAEVVLATARVGLAAWFFGNLYEGAVGVPELVAADKSGRNSTSVLGPGSPFRYFAPVAPIALGGTAAAVALGWDSPRRRGWLAATAAGTVVGGALSAYLIRTINLKLLRSAGDLTESEKAEMLRKWHGVNAVRLVAVGGALVAAHRAASKS